MNVIANRPLGNKNNEIAINQRQITQKIRRAHAAEAINLENRHKNRAMKIVER